MAKGTCSIAGCGRPQRARGWCTTHYERWRKNGHPLRSLIHHVKGPEPVRFWSHIGRVIPAPAHRPELGGCWLWDGRPSAQGYGRFTVARSGHWVTLGAHVWAWEDANGQRVPEGMYVDHLCSVRRCVRPDHLEAVTPMENTRRALDRCICYPRDPDALVAYVVEHHRLLVVAAL